MFLSTYTVNFLDFSGEGLNCREMTEQKSTQYAQLSPNFPSTQHVSYHKDLCGLGVLSNFKSLPVFSNHV